MDIDIILNIDIFLTALKCKSLAFDEASEFTND